ncbi:MAG TPA: BtaA family protein [Spirochaetia bacterium]|nr:BtaA family protein [Spirochaetia bacterium]
MFLPTLVASCAESASLDWAETPGLAARSSGPLSLHAALFRFLYTRNLLYNTCWEDPAVDRKALRLGESDRLLVITSAGCNALDYALEGPARVVAVDTNPRQTALLELKLAAIRHLSYEDTFSLFGRGWHVDFPAVYRTALRPELSPFARCFWDSHKHWFSRTTGGLFSHGLCGVVARAVQWRLRAYPALGKAARSLFEQPDLESQRDHYRREVGPRFWSPVLRAALSTRFASSLLGIPAPQRGLVRATGPGVSGSARAFIDDLFCTVPARDNYFWGLYVFGEYPPGCCPRYLTRDGFTRLKEGLVDRIEAHTSTVTRYLKGPGPRFTGAVLLDHMDWMVDHPQALAAEWESLYDRMEPGGRILFRSAHALPPYLEDVRVGPSRLPLREWLSFRTEEARQLARMDRVHTYASFHIAEVRESA